MYDSHDTAVSLGFLLNEVTTRWRQALDRRLRPVGLSQATWRALFHLEFRCDGLPQRELADSMGIEGPSLVRLLDALQQSGMIERREAPGDRRAKLVYLTPRGRNMLADIHAIAGALRAEILDGVAAEDLAVCGAVLHRINANIAKVRGDGQ